MLISKKINDAINQQIGNEFGASLQYVAIAVHFDCRALPGLAAHFYKQAEEEGDHAMRFVRFLVDADGEVKIPAVPAPKAKFATAEEAEKSSEWHLSLHVPLATAVTSFQIAIAISAIAILTRRKKLWYGGLLLTIVGIVFLILGIIP